jgi:CheY-like chemotaxis protein
VFDNDSKIVRAMEPLLQRVLIADPHTANAKLLGELMRSMVRCQVWAAPTTGKALKLAASIGPDVIFAELSAEGLDGVELTRRLRRSALACRQAPVIVLTGQAAAASILAARDAGVHELLTKPFTLKDLMRRLEAVTLRPRDWVEAVDYVGPDRRRFNSGDYSGALKRREDAPAATDAAVVGQALKILRSATLAVERDPEQAMRAMRAQAQVLHQAATAAGDLKLTTDAAAFANHIGQLEREGRPLIAAELERHAAPLLAHLPKAARGAAAAA